jgi:hypothetical protein
MLQSLMLYVIIFQTATIVNKDNFEKSEDSFIYLQLFIINFSEKIYDNWR